MEATHHRDGTKALLSYNVSKAPELSNPMDLNSAPTGNTCFILTEIYETEAGVADHFQQSTASWKDFPARGPVDGKVQSNDGARSSHHQLALVNVDGGLDPAYLPQRL